MKNKWISTLLVFSVAINLAAIATLFYFWQHGPVPPSSLLPPLANIERSMGPGWGWHGLDIPQEKKHEIGKLRRTYQEHLHAARQSLDESRRQLMQRMLQQPINRDSLDAAMQKIAAKQLEMEKMTIEHLLAMRSCLTDEQWENLVRMMDRDRREMRRMPFAPKERPQ